METHLSKGHGEGLRDAREGPGLGVVLQEDAVALDDHIWLTVDPQRALERRKAHRVAELPAVGRHLEATR